MATLANITKYNKSNNWKFSDNVRMKGAKWKWTFLADVNFFLIMTIFLIFRISKITVWVVWYYCTNCQYFRRLDHIRLFFCHLKINHLLMIVPSYLWHSWQNHTTLVTCRRSYTNISYFVAICWVSTYTKSGFHIYMYGSDRSIYRLIPVTVTFGGTCSNCIKIIYM